jgi:bifunctional non-homologous end joining protein LigD
VTAATDAGPPIRERHDGLAVRTRRVTAVARRSAADAGDADLETYREKRRFDETPEPRGRAPQRRPASPGTGRFVVQRHRARALHWDLRLEMNGVLASWAVPRGPTLDPGQRRLAVEVEDHPLEYFDFEGAIPAGQYGGGDVIVWDWGRWTADPETPDGPDAVRRGELKFTLDGVKLRGAWVLIRTGGRYAARSRKPKWLLIHRRDDAAESGWDAEDFPESVKTGRTNDEVARDHV